MLRKLRLKEKNGFLIKKKRVIKHHAIFIFLFKRVTLKQSKHVF